MALPATRLVNARWDDGRIAESKLPKPFTLPFKVPPVAVPYRTDATTDYYKFSMSQTFADIIPGYKTPVFSYNGTVPGPTIKATRGRPIVARFVNNLPAQHPTLQYEPYTSVHLHGSASLPQFDGYTSDITRPGQYKDYRYPNWQTGRTLWYHDHGVHHTAENVYHGLAGLYLMGDPLEQSLPLPKGFYDLPIVLSDQMFNGDGSLLFSLHDESGMWGDVITVNGVPWPYLKVQRRKYRFRILCASVSRSYNLRLSSGGPMTIVATDGGLMPKPVTVPNFRMSSAERYEVVIDFSEYEVGERIQLKNASPDNNDNYTHTNSVMQFRVVGNHPDPANNEIPDLLDPACAVMQLRPATAVATRYFRFERGDSQFQINGTTWQDVVDSGYSLVQATPKFGTTEIWELENKSGGWFHPVHIHLVDFKILDRNGQPPKPWERGPKDVVYLGENEKVRIIVRFDGGRGKYMMHCHNLIHEDHDMMAQFEVFDEAMPSDDPFSHPCSDLPELSDL